MDRIFHLVFNTYTQTVRVSQEKLNFTIERDAQYISLCYQAHT